jgi:hypothetical protein
LTKFNSRSSGPSKTSTETRQARSSTGEAVKMR